MPNLTVPLEPIIELLRQLPPEARRQVIDAVSPDRSKERELPPRIPVLYPNSMIIADDFDEPLPDEFWQSEKIAQEPNY